MGLLFLASIAIFVFTIMLAFGLERRTREAVVEAEQLGQYALEEKIGEGGMGVVYRAPTRCCGARRPIKLLSPQDH